MSHSASVCLLLACCLLSSAAVWGQDSPADRAAALFTGQDWAGAAKAYAALVEAEPTNGQAWLRLGQSHQRLGAHDDAIDALEKALKHGVKPASLSLARSFAAQGKKAKALHWLTRAADDGVKGYGAVVAMPEMADHLEDAAFKPVLLRLRPCGDPAFRQFDFWLGEWTVKNVTNPQGTQGAENHITVDHDGCVIRENYTNGAYTGMSVNWYDPGKGQWNQTWLDNQAYALVMSGGFENGSMVLASDASVSPVNRITWTPNDDGTVRQLWETSADGGKTWTVAFDGLYTRK